jgi:hypothetical protein
MSLREFLDRTTVEASTLDRGPLDDCPLARFETVDAGGQHSLDRWRDGEFVPLSLRPHGEQLLNEEGVTFGNRDDASAHGDRELVGLGQAIDQGLDLGLVERLEGDELRRQPCGGP